MKRMIRLMSRSRNQKGFTLVELLVAVMLIAIALLAVASMMGISVNSNSIANRRFVANLLAQQVMEDFLRRSVTDSTLTDPTQDITTGNPINRPRYQFDPSWPDPNLISLVDGGTYEVRYSVNPNPVLNGNVVPGVTQIAVFVYYVNPVGKSKPNLFSADPTFTNRAASVTAWKRIAS